MPMPLFPRVARCALIALLLVLAAGVAYFFAWDLWGIAEGVFLHRQSPYMTGVMLAPQLPLEEGFFLLFLSQITMVLFTGALRLLRGRRGDARAATPADPTDGGSR